MVNDIAVQDFVNAIKEPPTETVTSYNGVVSKIDKEGTAWVRVQGSNIETPTASSYVKVALGDKVSLNWRNNKLYIDGNYTDPSIGEGELDKVAVKIKAKLKKELEEEKEEEGGEGTIVAIWQEYNMSQYRTTPFRQASGYYWSETIWPYVRGLYMWIRYVYQYSDGTVEYGEPKFDMTNQSIAEANEAATNAANAAATASGIASNALEAASEKRRVFNSQPTTPYDLNDLWFDGTHGKTYLCTTARATGSFSSSDWTLYSEDVSNYFWHDSAGAHVSDTQGTVASGNSQTIASTGTVMMRNGKLVTSWTGSSPSDAALNFYDCSSSTARDADLVASYARAGITQYINNKKAIALTPSALSFFDPTDGTTPEAIFGSGGVNLYSEGKLRSSLDATAQTFYATDGQTPIAEFGETARIGKTSTGNNNIYIDSDGVNFRKATTALGTIKQVTDYSPWGDSETIPNLMTISAPQAFSINVGNKDMPQVLVNTYTNSDGDAQLGNGNDIEFRFGNYFDSDYNPPRPTGEAGAVLDLIQYSHNGATYCSLGNDSAEGTEDSSHACFFQAESDAQVVQMGVGSGGVNRGLYDGSFGRWMIYTDDVERVRMPMVYTKTSTSSSNVRCWTGDGDHGIISRVTESSERYKKDIEDIEGADALYDVQVRQFKYREDYLDSDDQRYDQIIPGFIAEELAEVYPIAVDLNTDGRPEDWSARYIIPPMLKLLQEQHAEIEELKSRLEAIERG